MSDIALDALYGFLGSWGFVIVLFYGLFEHRNERFRIAISIATFAIGLIFLFVLGLTWGKSIAFMIGWTVPCVLHMLFGRAPGMFVLRVVTRFFRGKANREK